MIYAHNNSIIKLYINIIFLTYYYHYLVALISSLKSAKNVDNGYGWMNLFLQKGYEIETACEYS